MTTTDVSNSERRFVISFFNSKRDNTPKESYLTWQDFLLRIEKPVIRVEKDGELFAPCLFEPKKRAKSNVEHLSMLVFDIDHNADSETIKTHFEKLQSAFLIYTSHSHLRVTKSNPNAEPRFRVCVPLTTNVPAERFPQLWQAVKKITGQPFDEAAKDASRMFYLPAIAEVNQPFFFYKADRNFLDWQLILDRVQPEISENGHKSFTKQIENATSSLPFSHIQIELDADASIDTNAFDSLMDNLPKFRLTWLRKRRDMQDVSPSSYDLALANQALSVGLSDQQVCNLLIAHRRSHKDDLKLDRRDYYQRTLAEAHDKTDPLRSFNEALQKPADPSNKNAMRKDIRDVLGIDIERIEKFLKEPTYFVIHFTGGRQITVGDSRGLLEQKDFRRFVSNAIGRPPEKLTTKAWDKITPKIFALVEERHIGEDTSQLGQLKEWLFEYAREYVMPTADVQQQRQSLARGAPGIIDGQICIYAKDFWQYIIRNRFDTKITRAMVIAQLTRLDARREKKSLRDDRNRVCSMSIYVLPADLSAEIIAQMSYAGFAEGDEDEFAVDEFTYAGQPDKDGWLPQL